MRGRQSESVSVREEVWQRSRGQSEAAISHMLWAASRSWRRQQTEPPEETPPASPADTITESNKPYFRFLTDRTERLKKKIVLFYNEIHGNLFQQPREVTQS